MTGLQVDRRPAEAEGFARRWPGVKGRAARLGNSLARRIATGEVVSIGAP